MGRDSCDTRRQTLFVQGWWNQEKYYALLWLICSSSQLINSTLLFPETQTYLYSKWNSTIPLCSNQREQVLQTAGRHSKTSPLFKVISSCLATVKSVSLKAGGDYPKYPTDSYRYHKNTFQRNALARISFLNSEVCFGQS